MSIPAIISAETFKRVKINFLELVFFINGGMLLCHYTDAGFYKWPFYLNSRDLLFPLINRCLEKAEPVSTLLMIILAILTLALISYSSTSEGGDRRKNNK